MLTEPNMIKTNTGIFPEELHLHGTPVDKRLGLTFVDAGGNPIHNNDNQEAMAYKTPEGHFVDFNMISKYNYLPEMGEGDLRGVYAGSLPELTIQKPAHGNSILNKLQGLITPPSANIGSSPWESVEIKSNDVQGKVPERLFHQVKPGQNLTQIAQNYGMTVNELSKYNPQINNLNFIKPGDTIYISPDEHKRKINAKEEWEKEKTANLSNLSAIHSVYHEGNYVIVNKAKGEFSIFNSGGKKIKTIKVETGKSGDDYHTKTYPDENGHIIPGIGNMSTPAGISFITGTGTYMGQPSFQRRRAGYDAKKGAMESSLHAGYTGTNVYTSNGCIRIQNKDLQELGKYIKYDTPIYTLPDKPGSRFVVSQGRLNFQADNPYGDQDESNPKWQWDDYDIYTDRTYAPISVSYSIDKNADKKYARNVKEYVTALVNNKEALQKELRINSYLYNKLMHLALGITEQESKFGTHPAYLIKQDANRSMPNIVYEGVLNIGRFIKTRGRRGIAAPSRGINQIKMRDDNEETQEAYRKFGVTEESVQNSIEKSAIATMIRLSRMYLDEIGGRDFFDKEGNKMDPFDVLLYKYMGRNDLLKAGATPNKNKYLKQVKQYSAPFNIYEYR